MTKVTKTKYSQLNDKSFYFPNGIILLPFGHASLEEISEFKTEKGQKIEIYFWQGKEKLSAMEKTALQKKNRRLLLFDNILNQQPKIVNLNQRTNFEYLYPKTNF